MKDLKKIIKMMIILLVIIILILILILKLNKLDDNLVMDEEELPNQVTEQEIEANDNGFKNVDDPTMFFVVWNSFNKYISVLDYKINENDTIEENPYEIKEENDKKKILFLMLDEEYKKDNNIITEDSINVKNDLDEISVIPIEMKVKYGDNVQIYALHVYIENVDEKSLQEEFFIIKIDNSNSTFSIKPLHEEYQNIDEIMENEQLNEIEVNDYNEYYMDDISDEALIKLYIQKYRYMSVNYPEIVYNNYFEEAYRNKRFGNYENFKKYIEDNSEEILSIIAMKYSKNSYSDYNEYIIKDQYDNTYIFKENSIMNYTLKLDTYTIATDKFKETYASAVDEKKVQMNIDKFFQMINRHDYKTAYSCLAESFKNNYFNTEEEFEEYAKDRFYAYSSMEFKSYEKTGSDIYVFKVELKDLLEENSESREINIIMQLQDDLDFRMSFDM